MADIAENQTIDDFSKGVVRSSGIYLEPPAFLQLKNLWFNSSGMLESRPFLKQRRSGNAVGLARSSRAELIEVVDGILYLDGNALTSIAGNGPVSFDNSWGRTIVTAGDQPVIINEDNSVETLPFNNVKSVATAHGPFGARLFFIKSNEPRTLYYTSIGDLSDIGTLITKAVTDTTAISDEYTEGGYVFNWQYDILDIIEFSDEIRIFTEYAIYSLRPETRQEIGFYPRITKTVDVQVYDTKVKRAAASIIFANHNGLSFYSIGETGPFVAPITSANKQIISREMLDSDNEVNQNISIGIDLHRNMYHLKTDTGNYWQYNLSMEGFVNTNWDIDFNDLIEINGTAYISNSNGTYELAENPDDNSTVDIVIQTGLSAFALGDSSAKNLKKRFKRAGLYCTPEQNDLGFHVQVDTEKTFEYEPQIPVEDYMANTPLSAGKNLFRLEQVAGKQGRFGSIRALVKIKSKTFFHYLYSQVKVKENLRMTS